MATSVPDTGVVAERRRCPRKKIIESQLLTAELALPRSAPGQAHRGLVIDLSEDGMALQPFVPLTEGSVGDLRLQLPGALVSGQGMVVWVGNGSRAGIRFIDLSPDGRAQLRRWLQQLPPTQNFPRLEIRTAPVPNPDAEEIDFQAALQLIVERAQVVTGASGAAIALGDRGGMVCRASCGTAPDPGAAVMPGNGLSGYCLSGNEIVYCADTQSDPRVDATAARQLGLGSVMVAPVFARGRLAGLLEVLAACPNAFSARQMTRLQRFSELLGTALEEHPQGGNSAELPGPPVRAGRPSPAAVAPAVGTVPTVEKVPWSSPVTPAPVHSDRHYQPPPPAETLPPGMFAKEPPAPVLHEEKPDGAALPSAAPLKTGLWSQPPVPDDSLPLPSGVSGGHPNPAGREACENSHNSLASVVAAPPAGAVEMKKVAEVPPAGPDLATPISPSSYAAPARSRARRALTVGLMILLLVAALVAVWYISRARAMRSVPASPVKARLESPLPDRDSAHSVVDKAR